MLVLSASYTDKGGVGIKPMMGKRTVDLKKRKG